MALQILRVTKEEAFGVYDTSSPVQQHVFLNTSNAFTVRATPQYATIRDAGQGNRRVRMIPGRKAVGGTLATPLFPSQAGFFLGFAAGLVGTEPCFDLGSFTCDHGIYTDNGCASYFTRYLGCKFSDFTLSCDDSDTGFLTTISGTIVGSVATDITLTDYPDPLLSSYPSDQIPYEFYHTAEGTGKLQIGTNRSDYYSLSVSIKNMLMGFGGESRTTQRVAFEGRDVSLSANLLLKSKADRTAYEDGTPQTVQLKFDDGAHTLLLDFGAKNIITGLTDDLPIGGKYTQAITLDSLMDPAVATDLTVTTT